MDEHVEGPAAKQPDREAEAEDQTPAAKRKVPLFGARKHAREMAGEVDRLREEQARLGVLDVAQLERRKAELTAEIHAQTTRLSAEVGALETTIRDLRRDVVLTEEEKVLQEVGVYEYRHPLSDSVAYQSALKVLKDETKVMNKADGGAVRAATNWTVNGSVAQGRTMVRDYSKLVLRAYNAEADNLVRGLKPYKLASAIDRLGKVAGTIERLGKTMDIEITREYHAVRVRELELTADYQEKLAEEKERDREEKARLREERKAQQEMERERARLEKEQAHYRNALAALEAKGDEEGAARLREQLADIDRAIEDVDYRAANIRAGYVYVISNVGSFGDGVVKIGMTRRLEPLDRVRELGDASVPFRYDVHTLFFAEDAVGIETALHHRFVARRVNRVNLRREFFRVTPTEARDALAELAGELLHFDEFPEAVEFRQSQHAAGPE